jgi:NAD(P)H dehydrogenase (quinone)
MSPSPFTIAVTGSTGVLGGFVARDLAARGIGHRLLVRTPSKAPNLPETTVHPFRYSDQAAAKTALEGVDTLFMVSASESADRLDQHRSFIDAAAAAGVRHIVYTSFIAAAPDATFTLARDHYSTEEYIKASGIAWTFLRDSFYIDFMEALVGDDGVIRGPAGEGRCAIVAREDVARAAAAVLVDPDPHAGRTYDITGPEALNLQEVAQTISRVRERQVTFHNETIDEAYASRRSYGVPDWQVDAWVSTYTAIGSNVMAPVSSAIESITGRAPISLEEFLITQTKGPSPR